MSKRAGGSEPHRRPPGGQRRCRCDCIVTTCPLCMFNLNSFQNEAGRIKGNRFRIPVLFLAQLIGLAFGLPPRRWACTAT